MSVRKRFDGKMSGYRLADIREAGTAPDRPGLHVRTGRQDGDALACDPYPAMSDRIRDRR